MGGDDDGLPPTCEEFIADCIECGINISDLEELTLGMCVNLINARIRLKKRINGIRVDDPEEQYRKLKAIEDVVEERFRSGKISAAKYEAYRRQIEEYEAL